MTRAKRNRIACGKGDSEEDISAPDVSSVSK